MVASDQDVGVRLERRGGEEPAVGVLGIVEAEAVHLPALSRRSPSRDDNGMSYSARSPAVAAATGGGQREGLVGARRRPPSRLEDDAGVFFGLDVLKFDSTRIPSALHVRHKCYCFL